jgi:low temperature requirement protein LtrA
MAKGASWEAVGQGLLVLAVLWWSWAGYAWLTSVVEPEEGPVRIAMFAVMAALLVVALCVPQAFGEDALIFAIAYGAVRIGHIVLFALASRDDAGLRRSVEMLATSTTIAIAFLLVASTLDGAAQAGMWIAALTVDMGGPAIFGLAGWKLVPGHFAERHNLVIILALGESIVALGIGAEIGLDVGVVAAAILGIALASALWWIYFDVVSIVTQRRLVQAEPGPEQNKLARDSYSYLHFPMVAGIILVAFGMKETLAHYDDPLETVGAFALLGGTAIYLLTHVALRKKNAGTWSKRRLGVALGLLALWPLSLALDLPALATVGAINLILWALIVSETRMYGEGRYRLRHGIEQDGDIPARAEQAGAASG